VTFETIKLSKQTAFWNKRLIGKRLRYFNTQTSTGFGGNISDRETLDLFNDGSFYYHIKNKSIVSSAKMQSGDKLSGDYRIITLENSTYLQLFCNDKTTEFLLTLSDAKHTLLDGKRYLLEDQ